MQGAGEEGSDSPLMRAGPGEGTGGRPRRGGKEGPVGKQREA